MSVASAGLVRARLGGAWVVLTLVSASHAVIHAYSALLPWIYPLAVADLHFSLTALGIMVGAANLTGGFLQLGAGALSRTVRRHALVGWGAVLLGASGIATALAANFAQFVLANVAARAVTSTQHPLGNSLLSDLYGRARRGTAIASHVAGGNLGTVLLTPGAALLVGAWGWRSALMLMTVPAVVSGVAIVSAIAENAPAPRPSSAAADLVAGVRQVGRSKDLILIFAASLVAAGGRGLGVVLLVVPFYLKRHLHIADPFATELYSLLLGGSVIGPLVAGRLSDRVGLKRVLLGAFALSALTTLTLLTLSPRGGSLAVVLLAMGLVVYAESPLLQTALANEAPLPERDALFSLYFAVTFGIGAFWAAGIGVLLDRVGFTAVFSLMVASYLAAGLCVLGLRLRPVRPAGPEVVSE